MANLAAFIGTFLAYGIVFCVFVALAVAGCFIGIKVRKSKDAKIEKATTNE